jgi:hypothetical protein
MGYLSGKPVIQQLGLLIPLRNYLVKMGQNFWNVLNSENSRTFSTS